MDWPSLILMTYGFLLALLLAVIILRSVNTSRNRYQKLLEEKEQKLSAIQLELEETMNTLGDQAAAVELALSEADRREKSANHALQQRLLEVQGAVVSAQSRLLRLEQGMEELKHIAALPPAAGIEIPVEELPQLRELPQAQPPPEEEKDAPAAGEGPGEDPIAGIPAGAGEEAAGPPPKRRERRGKARKGKDEAPQEAPAPGAEGAAAEEPAAEEPAEAGIRERLVALFEQGGTVAEASRAVGCSSVEAAMIYSQWKRGYLKENVPER